MKRFRLTLRLAVVGVAVAFPVAAGAPVGGADQQYENFDGDDKVIEDRFTRLVWDRPSAFAPYPAALSFADAKASCTGTKRLPSVKELLTIVDEDPHSDYDVALQKEVPRYIDEPAFSKTPTEPFWTSSVTAAGEVWTVDFGSGETKRVAPGDVARVRCVEYVGP